VSAITSLAGVASGILVGLLAQRFSLRLLVAFYMTAFGIATALFGLVPANFLLIAGMGAILGIFLFGSVTGLYATVAATFPSRMRATGVGFVTGIGRGGSALAPIIAGGLFAFGFGRAGGLAFGTCFWRAAGPGWMPGAPPASERVGCKKCRVGRLLTWRKSSSIGVAWECRVAGSSTG
jgi:MFS family permease